MEKFVNMNMFAFIHKEEMENERDMGKISTAKRRRKKRSNMEKESKKRRKIKIMEKEEIIIGNG